MRIPVLRIRIGFNADPDLDPTFFSVRIRIQGAKPMGIHADPDSDSGQTLLSQNVGF